MSRDNEYTKSVPNGTDFVGYDEIMIGEGDSLIINDVPHVPTVNTRDLNYNEGGTEGGETDELD